MNRQIEMAIEQLNHGSWLKVSIPYHTNVTMTATLENVQGDLLRKVLLVTGNNLIDLAAITQHRLRVRIDTPFECISKEVTLTAD